MYNPAKPKQSYIPGYDTKVYKILTIVFGIVGCIPILVCIGILFLHVYNNNRNELKNLPHSKSVREVFHD